MIEIAGLPRGRRMTSAAIVIEVILLVVRVSRRGEVSLMTVKAQARCAHISAGMTRDTGQRSVRTGQRKSRGAVVEIARFPRGRGMTGAAIVVEIILCMIRVCRSGKITAVAVKAQTWSTHVSAGMTGYASQ